jgi:hypothetical protein
MDAHRFEETTMTRSIRRLLARTRTLAIACVLLAPTIALAQATPGDYTDDTSLPDRNSPGTGDRGRSQRCAKRSGTWSRP